MPVDNCTIANAPRSAILLPNSPAAAKTSLVYSSLFMQNKEALNKINSLLAENTKESVFRAKQIMFCLLPPSFFVENYLFDNEGRQQKLDAFPMLRSVYDNLPDKMLLKCSRKTLKSTLISNIICFNLIRWNYYKMLYVAPLEFTANYFSQNYIATRMDSPPIKKLLVKGWKKNHVFEKTLTDTRSNVIFRYVNEDASRIRGPATDLNTFDECQDISYDQFSIVNETMALSDYKREIYAGTPLTTDNTINALWTKTNQMEWAFKCEKCNYWNTLTEDNKPLEKMILPEGLSCAKCGSLVNSANGEWVSMNPKVKDFTGYHLAQPILPFFNRDKKQWDKIYKKTTSYETYQVYNEVLGLAYDVGTKPITETDIRAITVLGNPYDKGSSDLKIYNQNKNKYNVCTCGVDWGVNMHTSRTSVCIGALREDAIYEVFYAKTYKDLEYKRHIAEIAALCNGVNAFIAADSGPDPSRSIELAKATSPQRCQLVRYEHGKTIQRWDSPKNAIDWRQNRWVLHRSDVLGFTIRLLKEGKILLPSYDSISTEIQDILNVYLEVKDGLYRQELFYRHNPDQPDDFLHALTWAVVQAYVYAGDAALNGPSSSSGDFSEELG